LIAELSKRRVLRVISGYAVVCFVILQIADVAFEPLGIGDGILRVIIAGMLLGLPLVAYLSWIFDVSPESNLQRSRTGKPWFEASITFLALLVLAIGAWFVLQPSAQNPEVQSAQGRVTEEKNVQHDAQFPATHSSDADPIIRTELRLEDWEDWITASDTERDRWSLRVSPCGLTIWSACLSSEAG